jgi:hypothetical protein
MLFLMMNLDPKEHVYLSQRTQSLGEIYLWIGEEPIQRGVSGLIFSLERSGQKPNALIP